MSKASSSIKNSHGSSSFVPTIPIQRTFSDVSIGTSTVVSVLNTTHLSSQSNIIQNNTNNSSINANDPTGRSIGGSNTSNQRSSSVNASNNNKTSPSHTTGLIAQTFPTAHHIHTYYPSKSTLSALYDESSTYPAVSRACLYLNQFCSSPHQTNLCDLSHINKEAFDGTNDYANAQIFHIPTYLKQITVGLHALMKCASNHQDRQCKSVAIKCLSIFAKSMFAKLRFSQSSSTGVMGTYEKQDEHVIHEDDIFGVQQNQQYDYAHGAHGSGGERHVSLSSVEDECSIDASVVLAECAINDVDEGVSAIALESLAILCCDYGVVSGLDPFMTEIRQILYGINSDSNNTTHHEKEQIDALIELQQRVMENVISPRIRRMIHRISCYRNTDHIMKALPFISTSLSYFCQLSVPHMITSIPSNSSKFAKRWYEMDYLNMTNEVISQILLPGMSDGVHPQHGYSWACALCCLRLINSMEKSGSITKIEIDGYDSGSLCRQIAQILLDKCFDHMESFQDDETASEDEKGESSKTAEQFLYCRDMMETRSFTLAITLIACRAIPSFQYSFKNCNGNGAGTRQELLLGVLEGICCLPVFETIPENVFYSNCVSNLLSTSNDSEGNHSSSYYRPRRMGLLTEVILNILVDGTAAMVRAMSDHFNNNTPSSSSSLKSTIEQQSRSDVLRYILESDMVQFVLDHHGPTNNKDDATSAHFEGPSIAEELIYAFCSTSAKIGHYFDDDKASSLSSPSISISRLFGMEEWLRCSLEILSNFDACVTTWWRSGITNIPTSESYLQLLFLCLSKINGELSSKFIEAIPTIFPFLCLNQKNSNHFSSSSSSGASSVGLSNTNSNHLSSYDGKCPTTSKSILSIHCGSWAKNKLGVICDQLLQEISQQQQQQHQQDSDDKSSSIVSKMKLIQSCLLSILANQWSQNHELKSAYKSTFSAFEEEQEGGKDHLESSSFNSTGDLKSGRLLLSKLNLEMLELVEEIQSIFIKGTEENHDDYSEGENHFEEPDCTMMMKLFLVYVHSIENMALSACTSENNNDSFNKETEEDDIISMTFKTLNNVVSSLSSIQKTQNISLSKHNNNNNVSLSQKEEASTMIQKMAQCCIDLVNQIQQVVLGKRSASSISSWVFDNNTFVLSTNRQNAIPSMQQQYLYSPSLISKSNALCPNIGQLSLHDYEEGLYWHQFRLLIQSRTRKALQFSPLGWQNMPAGTGGIQHQNQTSDVNTSRDLLDGISNSSTSAAITSSITRFVVPPHPLRLPAHVDVVEQQEEEEDFLMSNNQERVQIVTGASDPLCIVIAYGVRNVLRYDGEEEPHLHVTIRINNVTPVSIPNGLRLDLYVSRQVISSSSENDFINYNSNTGGGLTDSVLSSLNIKNLDDVWMNQNTTTSTSAIFKDELEPYGSLTWEIIMHQWHSGALEMSLSATFREMTAETQTHRWLSCGGDDYGSEKDDDDKNIKDREGNNDDSDNSFADDMSDLSETGLTKAATMNRAGGNGIMDEDEYDAEDEILDVSFVCEPVMVEETIILRPCPLVFWNRTREQGSNNGDESVFWYFWWNMPRKVVRLFLSRQHQHSSFADSNHDFEEKKSNSNTFTMPQDKKPSNRIFKDSSLLLDSDNGRKGGPIEMTSTALKKPNNEETSRGWAFLTWCKNRMLCFVTEKTTISNNDTNNNISQDLINQEYCTLEIRADDVMVMLSFVGSKSSRARFIENLLPGEGWECDEEQPEKGISLNEENNINGIIENSLSSC